MSLIKDLAVELVDLQEKLKELEEEVKEHKSKIFQLATKDIPEAMDDIDPDSDEIVVSGIRLKIGQAVHGSITKANQIEAFEWLHKNGHGGLIKADPSIHPGTLKSWIKARLEEEDDIPQCISYHIHPIAKAKKVS